MQAPVARQPQCYELTVAGRCCCCSLLAQCQVAALLDTSMLCPRLGVSPLALPAGPSWREGTKSLLVSLPWSWCQGLLCAPAAEVCVPSGCSIVLCSALGALPTLQATPSQAETCYPGCMLCHFPGHVPLTALGAPAPGGMTCRALFQHEKK